MKKSVAIWYLIVLCVCGFLVDGAMALMTAIGIPRIIAGIVPVLVFGTLLEAWSLRRHRRNKIVKWIRIIIFGALFACVIVNVESFIIEAILMFVIFFVAANT